MAPPVAYAADLFDSSESARVLKLMGGQTVDVATLLDLVLGSGAFGSLESPSIRGLAELCSLGLAKRDLQVTDVASCLCKARWFDCYDRTLAEKAVMFACDGEGCVDVVVLAVALLVPKVFLEEFSDRLNHLGSRQAKSEQDLADKLQFKLAFSTTKIPDRTDTDWIMSFDSFDRSLTGVLHTEKFLHLNRKFAALLFGKKEAAKRLSAAGLDGKGETLPESIDSLAKYKALVEQHSTVLPYTAFLMVDTYFRYMVAGNMPPKNAGMFGKEAFLKAVCECRATPQAVLAAEDPIALVFRSPIDQLDFLCWADVLCFEPKARKPRVNELLLASPSPKAADHKEDTENIEELRSRFFSKTSRAWELGDFPGSAANRWEESLRRQIQRYFIYDGDGVAVKYITEFSATANIQPAGSNGLSSRTGVRKITRLSDSVIEVDLK